uniref:Variant surface glycoprotein 1125.257 n=1 Tax=Trypanosoma brucei TaxID=5691 RepID=A0A1J0R5I9_9TRYP|nr:variant surface glycoprotein 1125.257 [Trypanosoma brucei]
MHRAALALAITLVHVNGAAPPDGSHRYVLHHFCVLLKALQYTLKPNTNWADVKNIMDAASTISLLLNSRDAVEKTEATTSSTAQEAQAKSAQKPNPCGGDKRTSCVEAKKKFIDDRQGVAKKHLLSALTSKSYVTRALNATTQRLEQRASNLATKAQADLFKEMKTTLKKALFGNEDGVTNSKIFGSAGSRTIACGAPSGPTGASAGAQTLAAAMLCICASDSTTQNNKVCEADGTDEVTFGAAGTNATAAYSKIEAECGKPDEAATHGSPASLLEAAIRGLEDDLSKGKGSGNNVGILGTIAGAGSGACSGDHSTNNGACMFAGATNGRPTTPTWLKQLKVAASEGRQAEAQLVQIMADEAELASSNSTLSALMATALNQAEEASAKPNTQKESTPAKVPETNETCKAKGKGDNCKDGCKEITENGEKKCVVDETKVTTQTNAAAGDGAAKPGANCSSHATKEACEGVTGTPAPGKKAVCGWIEDKCKDSSILESKKFP